MNIKLAILGAILIAICVVPVILIIRSSKKAQRHLLQSLKRIAKQINSHIDQYDMSNDFIIGIDETKKMVFFYQNLSINSIEQVIELSNYNNCSINKTKRTLKKSTGSTTEIEKLELIFMPKSNDLKSISLEFFNFNESNQLTNQLQIIEKWSDLINSKLK